MGPGDDTGMAAIHSFDQDTAVRPVTDGHYDATISDRWGRLGGGPNGGYLLAVCLRALCHALPPADPLAVSAFFLEPGVTGAAQVRTELVRTGRRFTTGQARLVQDGAERVRAVATFTDLATSAGRTAIFADPPDLPPPDDCVDPLAGRSMDGVTIADRIEYRMREPPGWQRGRPSGRPITELWARLEDGRDADPVSLALLVDAAAPVVLELGELGSTTLELSVHMRDRPAPGWMACRIATRYVINGFHEEDFEIWDSRSKLVAQARQLAILPDRTEP